MRIGARSASGKSKLHITLVQIRSSLRRLLGRRALFVTTGPEELKILAHDLHATALFFRVLVLPLLKFQSALDKQRAPLRDVLGNRLHPHTSTTKFFKICVPSSV